MRDGIRAAMAFIAGNVGATQTKSAIYDYSIRKYRQFSGSVSASNISLYDHEDKCHITGHGQKGHYSIYHFGAGSHLDLNIAGRQLSGYDYGSGDHFSGNISDGSISIYDYGLGKYFDYSF